MICWFAENCAFLLDISAQARILAERRVPLPVPILSPGLSQFRWDDGHDPDGFADWMI
jgi:hypothetical protein